MFNPATLERMDIQAKETVEKFLQEVVAWGGRYYLEEGVQHHGKSRTVIGCRVVFVGENAPPPMPYVYADYSYITDWFGRQILVPGGVEGIEGKELAPTFSEGVMKWYLENRRLSEHDIRVLIGRRLRQRFLAGSEQEPFDLDVEAKRIGVSSDDLYYQSRTLMQLDYAKTINVQKALQSDVNQVPTYTRNEILNWLHLTKQGHKWATAGYPPESMGLATHVTVNVDVHMAVTNVIEQAQKSDVDEETKERFELMMRRLEVELRKPEGEGSMESVKDVLEVANNAKGLMGPAVKFVADNWDKIQQFSGLMF